MSRSFGAEDTAAAEALATLASLVRSGYSLRGAVAEWPRAVPTIPAESIARHAAAVAVGARPGDVDLPSPASRSDEVLRRTLAAAASADRRGPGLAARVLEAQANDLRRSVRASAEADAGTSGARLSGRLIAGLPLAFLLLVPVTARSWSDPLALVTIAVGVLLIAAGIRWMSRMMPAVPSEHPAAAVARELAGLMVAGAIASEGLSTVAGRHGWAPLIRARAATKLGLGWIDALSGSPDPHCRRLGHILGSGRRAGSDVPGELDRYAAEVEAGCQVEFERALRRAPVLMVLPLTICMLPGFALLTLGPFLRQLLA